jgi:hypothetical protein
MAKGRSALSRLRGFFPAAKTVTDAKHPLTIRVEPQDRSGAKRKAPDNCAMARACIRKLGVDGAVISLHSAYLLKGNKVTRYRVPESLRREIVTFDRFGGKGFANGEYLLSKPGTGHKIGGRKKVAPKGRAGKPKQVHGPKRHRKIHVTEGVRSLA